MHSPVDSVMQLIIWGDEMCCYSPDGTLFLESNVYKEQETGIVWRLLEQDFLMVSTVFILCSFSNPGSFIWVVHNDTYHRKTHGFKEHLFHFEMYAFCSNLYLTSLCYSGLLDFLFF